MNLITLLLLPSVIALVLLPWIENRKYATHVNAILCSLSFIISIILGYVIYVEDTALFFFKDWFMCDKLNVLFIILSSFIGMSTSFYSISYLDNENKTHLHPLVYRFYHTTYQLFLLGMLIVLLSNNIGMMWIAMELATISSIALVGLRQTPQALEASWKYLILCGVGIGFALLGTVILYFGAYTHGLGEEGLLWTKLMTNISQIPAKLLSISFVFLFVGYGTKVGFVPLHNWLPDAYAEGYPMVNALSSGALLNLALFALLKFKLLFANAGLINFPCYLFLTFGFISLFFAALSLFRQRTLNRLLAYSSIEHMGLISIAIGIGNRLALLTAILHIWIHALVKTALLLISGTVIQQFHTQVLQKIRALFEKSPITASLFLISFLAILGLPPSGLFISELLLILAAMEANIGLMILLVVGLILAFLAILLKTQPLFFGQLNTPITHLKNTKHIYWTVGAHLILVIIAGLYMPIFLLDSAIYSIIGGKS
ncbi:proton-conducting transporter membrane subunit [Fastidiosibacter lacustris]|uniref:proton-conducting transporter transmembrane domain-containing protein n=1 Tax=Fastidiosibacter lacustris TaxID=2056695 RepID=UPI000E347EB2|nr:proton-conducting transporter membrane subunit [Fastidiosibacter lacustris]